MLDNILVVKLGGGDGLDMPRACADLAQIAQQRPLVVVHGVSARMNQMCEDLNVPVQTLKSPGGHTSRYTDPRTRDIFVAACRSVNRDIVEWLYSHNINAQGINAADAIVVEGERKSAIRAVMNGRVRIIRDDYSGSINGVRKESIMSLLEQGIVPVLPPIAASDDGLLNVDGDRASAAVAAALDAEELIILSNVSGLFRNANDPASRVAEITISQLPQAMEWAQGRMKRKVLGAQEALDGGVRRVTIGDGRIGQPVTHALNGEGTTFTI